MKLNKPIKFSRLLLKNPSGCVIKYISKKDYFFKKFGEVYFNKVLKNKKKGWIYHKKTTCFLLAIQGHVNFHIIDGRKKKKTFHREYKFTLDDKIPEILIIPKNFWFSFSSNKKISLIINLIENVHSDDEVIKKNCVKGYCIN